jgi:hypothetical protein
LRAQRAAAAAYGVGLALPELAVERYYERADQPAAAAPQTAGSNGAERTAPPTLAAERDDARAAGLLASAKCLADLVAMQAGRDTARAAQPLSQDAAWPASNALEPHGSSLAPPSRRR